MSCYFERSGNSGGRAVKLKLRGLKDGEHVYSFNEPVEAYGVDQELFSENLEYLIVINVQGKYYYISVSVKTLLKSTCDRCSKVYLKPYAIETKLIYTEDTTLDPEQLQDDLHYLPAGQDSADLSENIRQNLLLNLPVKYLCSKSCKGLCSGCGENLNENQCKCTGKATDPRWEALKYLQN
jgi:uncharacterized protein